MYTDLSPQMLRNSTSVVNWLTFILIASYKPNPKYFHLYLSKLTNRYYCYQCRNLRQYWGLKKFYSMLILITRFHW